jgi:hypothetical protein
MTRRRSQQRREARLMATLEKVIIPERRTHLPVHIWRWRHELAVGVGTAIMATALVRSIGIEWATISVSAVIGTFGPPWPRWFIGCAWRIITPHRLRTGMVQARIQNRKGRMPVIRRVTREPFGERVLLWCPAGTSAEDLRSARVTLRAACWAADVRVTRDGRHSQLVTVDVIRHRDDTRHGDDTRHRDDDTERG